MKIKFSRKTMNLLKKVGCVILALVACLGCVSVFSGISELANDDYQLAVPSYSIGGLDETTGKKTEDECAIYTKDLIECTGIELYADFDSDIKYVVHFYDEDENWLSCQENEGLNLKVDQMPEGAAFKHKTVIDEEKYEEEDMENDPTVNENQEVMSRSLKAIANPAGLIEIAEPFTVVE